MFFFVDNNWCWFNDVIVVFIFIGVLLEKNIILLLLFILKICYKILFFKVFR